MCQTCPQAGSRKMILMSTSDSRWSVIYIYFFLQLCHLHSSSLPAVIRFIEKTPQETPPRYVFTANINKIHHKQCEKIVIFLSSVGVNLATSIAFFSLATLSEQLILYCLLVFVPFYWKYLFFTPLSLIKIKSILVFCS